MKISIITVSKNAEDTIEDTIRSVIAQTYGNIEYIIIDGKSEDKTMSLISKYRKKISYLDSKPDKGIYDAMNKGIKRASGEFVMFMNANDRFYGSTTLEKLVKEIQKTSADIVFGDVIMFNPLIKKSFYWKYQKIDKGFLYYDNIPHQGSIFRTELFNKYGMYNLSYPSMADHEWFLRAFLANKVQVHYVSFPVVYFNFGGASTSWSKAQERKLEREKIRKQYFSFKERLLFKIHPLNVLRKIRLLYNLRSIS